jgi:hypothetical protein
MNERFADRSALQLSYKTYKRNAASEPLLPWLDMNHDKLYHMLVAQVGLGCSFLVEGLFLHLFTFGLFNDDASCSGYVPPHYRMNSE